MQMRDRSYWRSQGRRRRRAAWLERLALLPAILFAMGMGAVATVGLQQSGLAAWMLDAPAPRVAGETHPARAFRLCGGGARVSCVVDGDTFWLDGVKIRIADINTPETGEPQCAAEAALGRQAAQRLAELLSAGAFSPVRIDRDADQYGRKLRIVERDGRSLGAVLVAEGLAHEWRGRREGWCWSAAGKP